MQPFEIQHLWVIQGHWKWRHSIDRIYAFLLKFNSNYGSSFHHFWYIWYQKHCILEFRVWGHSTDTKNYYCSQVLSLLKTTKLHKFRQNHPIPYASLSQQQLFLTSDQMVAWTLIYGQYSLTTLNSFLSKCMYDKKISLILNTVTTAAQMKKSQNVINYSDNLRHYIRMNKFF